MSMILLGTILKPQGIKGEVKVKAYTSDLDRFLSYDRFFVGEKVHKVKSSRTDGQYAYVLFEGVSDMNGAEVFREKEIFVDRSQLPKLSEGEFYIEDLVGSAISFDGANYFAVIKEVATETRNVVISAICEGKTYHFPLLKELVISFDVENKKMTLKESRFLEVSLIED